MTDTNTDTGSWLGGFILFLIIAAFVGIGMIPEIGPKIIGWIVAGIFLLTAATWLLHAAVTLVVRLAHPQPGDLEKVAGGIFKTFWYGIVVIPIGGLLGIIRRF